MSAAVRPPETAESRPSNSLLGPGTAFEGLLTFRGSARLDGQMAGEVRAQGLLILGPTAHVHARIEVDELVVSGQLEGDVYARTRVALEPGARVNGSVITPRLQMADGALLEGTCQTGAAAAKPLETPGKA